MSLFKVIDGLFAATRYGVLGLSILGAVGSIILFFFNISMGVGAWLTVLALLALSVSVAMFLVPNIFVKNTIASKNRYVSASVLAVIAVVVMGIVYFVSGGFPELNLLFV